MRGSIFIGILISVVLMTAPSNAREEDGVKIKKREGCRLNGQLYEEGEIAYEDRSHCFRLKCIKTVNKKGIEKYILKKKRWSKRCFCSAPCPKCSNIWDPVCGTNNKTYTNGCQLMGFTGGCGNEQAQLLHEGECGKCPGKCPQIKRPVCGTNNVTYRTECHLLKASCDSSSIQVAYRLACKDVPPLPYAERKCKFNGKRYKFGETIEYSGSFCLEVICKPSKRYRPMVVFQHLKRSCNCRSRDGKDKRLKRETLMPSRKDNNN